MSDVEASERNGRDIKLIAAALGLRLAWDERRYGHRDEPMVRSGWRIVTDDGLLGDWWNPRRSDGDALQVASLLHMQINNHPDCVEARCWAETGSEACVCESAGNTNKERFAATRKAIVGAAVEMLSAGHQNSESRRG